MRVWKIGDLYRVAADSVHLYLEESMSGVTPPVECKTEMFRADARDEDAVKAVAGIFDAVDSKLLRVRAEPRRHITQKRIVDPPPNIPLTVAQSVVGTLATSLETALLDEFRVVPFSNEIADGDTKGKCNYRHDVREPTQLFHGQLSL
jgi:hypothetical protein